MPRITKSNLPVSRNNEIESDEFVDESAYNCDNPPSTKSKKKMKDAQVSDLEKIMESALCRLNNLDRVDKAVEKESEKSEDQVFCELILKMLNEISDSADKYLLKLEIQQKLIKLKHKIIDESLTSTFTSPLAQLHNTQRHPMSPPEYLQTNPHNLQSNSMVRYPFSEGNRSGRSSALSSTDS